jgi:hypothetical protein
MPTIVNEAEESHKFCCFDLCAKVVVVVVQITSVPVTVVSYHGGAAPSIGGRISCRRGLGQLPVCHGRAKPPVLEIFFGNKML